jgi:hypothetical protein
VLAGARVACALCCAAFCRVAAVTHRGQAAAKARLLDLLSALQQQQDSSSAPSEQQLLQHLVQKLLRRLMVRERSNSNLSVRDLGELLCSPVELSTSDRQNLLMGALLQAAYVGEGAQGLQQSRG